MLRKTDGFKKNTNNHGLLLRYNIRTDTIFGLGYVSVRHVPCSCSAC